MVYVTSRKIVPDENTASNETVITPELENSADSNQEIFSSDFDSRKIILHTVEKGDTLWNIAKRYEGASVQQIMKINNLNSPEDLKLGAKIKIPLGS
jgi:nucleoid-associated protein YgaU